MLILKKHSTAWIFVAICAAIAFFAIGGGKLKARLDSSSKEFGDALAIESARGNSTKKDMLMIVDAAANIVKIASKSVGEADSRVLALSRLIDGYEFDSPEQGLEAYEHCAEIYSAAVALCEQLAENGQGSDSLSKQAATLSDRMLIIHNEQGERHSMLVNSRRELTSSFPAKILMALMQINN